MRTDSLEVNIPVDPPAQPRAVEPTGAVRQWLARTDLASFVLRRGALLPLPAAVGTRIRCDCGTVWITQDHDPRDIVLERGESFQLDVDQPALVQAFDFSVISVSAPVTRLPPTRC